MPVGDAVCARVRQLKQMRELQQEQEVLLQGLEMMARGREWYQQQLQRLQERQHRLGQSRASSVSDAAPWARLHPHPRAQRPSPHSDPLPRWAEDSGCPSTQSAGSPFPAMILSTCDTPGLPAHRAPLHPWAGPAP